MSSSRTLPKPAALAEAVLACERPAVATALNLLDDTRAEARACAADVLAVFSDAQIYASGHLIGLTGPPGVGKSSVLSTLITRWRAEGRSVGVLAVDPTSPISGGALLGDRLRMLGADADERVFIRSLACRGEVGGLSAEVWPMSLVMLAAFDVVLVETVGVGQKEIDVSKLTDTTCFVAQPASGDSIQFLKAGIMEVPHVLVVNKADLGAAARKTLSELRGSLGKRHHSDDWEIPILSISASQGTGIDALVEHLEAHRRWLVDHELLATRRQAFQSEWLIQRLRGEFGYFGIEMLGGEQGLRTALASQMDSPLRQYESLRSELLSHWQR